VTIYVIAYVHCTVGKCFDSTHQIVAWDTYEIWYAVLPTRTVRSRTGA
jgi:hypothetical protein